eukprot:349632-Chlamydomonas_euryale.AAC.10
MESYDRVAKVVAPKRKDLQVAEGDYAVVIEGLNQKQAELAQLMQQLEQLETQLKCMLMLTWTVNRKAP